LVWFQILKTFAFNLEEQKHLDQNTLSLSGCQNRPMEPRWLPVSEQEVRNLLFPTAAISVNEVFPMEKAVFLWSILTVHPISKSNSSNPTAGESSVRSAEERSRSSTCPSRRAFPSRSPA